MAKIRKRAADIRVSGEGPMTTVYLFTPLTKRGARVLREAVDGEAQWLGSSLAVEHRYAESLAHLLAADYGLEVV